MRYETYQQTGLVWLPEVPSRWDLRFLSQAAKEQIIKKQKDVDYPVMSLSYGNVIRKKNINAGLIPATYDNYQVINDGNIILRLTDLQNDHTSLRTGLAHETGIITSAYTCLQLSENPAYIHYLLHAYDTRKLFYGMGGGVRQSIGYKDIRNMMLPIPPRDEQNQIARYLDWKVSEINKLIVAKKKQITLLLEQRGALIDKAILHGIRECPQKDSGVYWLGNVPETWTISSIKRICQVNASTTHIAKGKDSAEMVTFLPMENVSVTGVVDCSLKKPISEVCSGFSSFARNDVVVAKITPCFENGKGACLDELDTEIGYGTTEFINLRASEKVLPKYLYMITMTRPFRKLGEKVMTGSAGQKRIPVSFIKNFLLGVPSTNEQEEILQWLNDMLLAIDKMIEAEKQYIDILHELRTRLISDVVTGQIDVRNIAIPDFELVEEIDTGDESPDGEVEPSEVDEQ